MDTEKRDWFISIGAKEYQDPIRFMYTFDELDNFREIYLVSDKYVEETPLEEIKEQYEKNKIFAQELIELRKNKGDFRNHVEDV